VPRPTRSPAAVEVVVRGDRRSPSLGLGRERGEPGRGVGAAPLGGIPPGGDLSGRADRGEVGEAVRIQVRHQQADGVADLLGERLQAEAPEAVVADDVPGAVGVQDDEVDVAVVVDVERGDAGVPPLPRAECLCVGPRGQLEGETLRCRDLPGVDGDRGEVVARLVPDLGRHPVIAEGGVRHPLRRVVGPGLIHDVEVEVAVLVQVEPARRRTDGLRRGDAGLLGHVLEPLPFDVAEQDIRARPRQEEVDAAIGVEVPRGRTEAGPPGQSPGRRGILELPVAAVQEEDVPHPLGIFNGAGDEEVESAVAIRVECGDGRRAGRLGDRLCPLGPLRQREVPPCPFGPADRLGSLGGFGLQLGGVDDEGVFPRLAVDVADRIAVRLRVAALRAVELPAHRQELLAAFHDLGPLLRAQALVGRVEELEGRVQPIVGRRQVGRQLQGLLEDRDLELGQRQRGRLRRVDRVGHRAAEVIPRIGIRRILLGHELEVLVGLGESSVVLEEDSAAVVGVEVPRVATQDPGEEGQRLLEVRRRGGLLTCSGGRRERRGPAPLLLLLNLHPGVVEEGDRQVDRTRDPAGCQRADLAELRDGIAVLVALHVAEPGKVRLDRPGEIFGGDQVRLAGGGIGLRARGRDFLVFDLAAGPADGGERGDEDED
jgi:hypothetical protein